MEKKSQEIENIRTGTSPKTLAQALLDNLYYIQGRPPELATRNDWYMALAYTVRDRLLHDWLQTLKTIAADAKVVSYLSAEFLLGPQLGNNLLNLGIWEQVREAVSRHGLTLEELLAHEGEPGLGNGGLGRLAACYLDSLASLDFPSLLERIGKTMQYESCLLGLNNGDLDPDSQMNVWLSSSSNHAWNPRQASPATPWEAEIDRLMKAQASEAVATRRKALFDRVQEIVWEQAPIVYVLNRNALVAVSHSLGNVRPSVLAPRVIWNIDEIYLAGTR